MLVAFWALAAVALVLALLQLGVALRLGSRLEPLGAGHPGEGAVSPPEGGGDAAVHADRPRISALVPLRGAPAGLEDRLRRLLSALGRDDQLVLATETEDDPAYAVATAVEAAHPDRDVEVVLSGPAGVRMGKQHNLGAALNRARHDLLAFMDDDVLIERANLEDGVAALTRVGEPTPDGTSAPAVGAAFALPFYGADAGSGRSLGGDVVAAYTNHGFAPNMASIALQGPPRFIIGGYWMTTREALGAIGGLEPFTATVSDDAAIGRAFAETGRSNVMLGRPVRLEPERLDLRGGVRHVLKWLTLLRAEGLGVLILCYLTWHPLATALLAALLSWLAQGVSGRAGLSVLAAVLALRALAVLVLDTRVYGLRPPGRYLPAQLFYEALLAPWLFLVAAFRREVVWRGRRYRLAAGGRLEAAQGDRGYV